MKETENIRKEENILLRKEESRGMAGNGLKGEQGEGVSPRNKKDHIFLKTQERKSDKRILLNVKEERCINLYLMPSIFSVE